jgi:hypothetical protein
MDNFSNNVRSNNLRKRFILFIFGCILVRILIAISVHLIDPEYLPFVGWIALIPAMGWIMIYATGSRKTGMEVMGDVIWWNDLRIFHAATYGIFSILAMNKNKYSWIVLLFDVMIGLAGFINHHYKSGNFSILFQ